MRRARASRWAGLNGVSPMVKRESTAAESRCTGERSRTSSTTTGVRPAPSASWVNAVVAWPRTPWTPAGPSAYAATWVTISMSSGTVGVYGWCRGCRRMVQYTVRIIGGGIGG